MRYFGIALYIQRCRQELIGGACLFDFSYAAEGDSGPGESLVGKIMKVVYFLTVAFVARHDAEYVLVNRSEVLALGRVPQGFAIDSGV